MIIKTINHLLSTPRVFLRSDKLSCKMQNFACNFRRHAPLLPSTNWWSRPKIFNFKALAYCSSSTLSFFYTSRNYKMHGKAPFLDAKRCMLFAYNLKKDEEESSSVFRLSMYNRNSINVSSCIFIKSWGSGGSENIKNLTRYGSWEFFWSFRSWNFAQFFSQI